MQADSSELHPQAKSFRLGNGYAKFQKGSRHAAAIDLYDVGLVKSFELAIAKDSRR